MHGTNRKIGEVIQNSKSILYTGCPRRKGQYSGRS